MKKTLTTLATFTILLQSTGGLLTSTTHAAPIQNANAEQYRCEAGHQSQAGHEHHNYCPTTKDQLAEVITALQKTRGREGDYNDIDTGKITDMSELFRYYDRNSGNNGYGLHNFNGKIDKRDTSSVVNMKSMFEFADFNKDISKWNVSSVINMEGMFSTSKFNQPIGERDVSNVTNMGYMFGGMGVADISYFNQPIGKWNVGNVKNMEFMFANNEAFNQPIGNRDTSNVTNMSFMFQSSPFNQPIGERDTSNVTKMNSMLEGWLSFDQDISKWKINNIDGYDKTKDYYDQSSMYSMLWGQKLSITNYNKLLISLYNQAKDLDKKIINFDGGKSIYCTVEAEQARQKLIDEYGRTITDGGKVDCPESSYTIQHYWQNSDRGYSDPITTETMTGIVGSDVTATPQTFTGWEYDATHTGAIATGTIADDGSLILKLHYRRIPATSTQTATITGSFVRDNCENDFEGIPKILTFTGSATATGYTLTGAEAKALTLATAEAEKNRDQNGQTLINQTGKCRQIIFRASVTFTGSDTFTPQCATGRSASDITLTHRETAMNVTGSTPAEAQQNAEKLAQELVKDYLATDTRKTAGQKQADDTCTKDPVVVEPTPDPVPTPNPEPTIFTGSYTATGSQMFSSTMCQEGYEPKPEKYNATITKTATATTKAEADRKAQELAEKAVLEDIKTNGQNYVNKYGICEKKEIPVPPIPELPHTGAEW